MVESFYSVLAAIGLGPFLPLPRWQKDILDESKRQYDANPESFLSWEQVQENIRKKHEA